MDKHYKTKLNSSFISNTLPKTFIECLKKEKCYRSFIKYMISHCDLYLMNSKSSRLYEIYSNRGRYEKLNTTRIVCNVNNMKLFLDQDECEKIKNFFK